MRYPLSFQYATISYHPKKTCMHQVVALIPRESHKLLALKPTAQSKSQNLTS